MEKVTSIDEYRRRRPGPPNPRRHRGETPRARAAGEPTFDVVEVLRRLESIRSEMNYYLLDVLEETAVDRLDQIRRYGLGLNRRIALATARKVEHKGLTELVRAECGRPKLGLVRGVHLRILHVPVIPDGRFRPSVEAFFVLARTDETVTLVGAALRSDGSLAGARRTLRLPSAVAFLRREPVDRFLRDYLRDLFEELESAPPS